MTEIKLEPENSNFSSSGPLEVSIEIKPEVVPDVANPPVMQSSRTAPVAEVQVETESSYSPKARASSLPGPRGPSGPPKLGWIARTRLKIERLRSRLRKIEKDSALIALGAFLAASAAFLMIVGFSFEKPELTFPVGKVVFSKGTALRQLESESEYRAIGVDTGAVAGQDPGVVYNRDTVLTGATSTLKINFDNGAWVEMENDTMIRLLFDAGPEKGRIQVIAGRVKGSGIDVEQKDGQKWIPLANQIDMISPRPGERLRVEDPTIPLQRIVRFEWKLPVPSGVMEIRLNYVGLDRSEPSYALVAEAMAGPGAGVSQPEVFRRVIGSKNGLSATFVPLSRPGIYEWELRDAWGNSVAPAQGPEGRVELKRQFSLSPELELIQTAEPLVAGKLIKTNLYQGEPLRAADLTLRWAQFGSSGRYMVDLLESPSSRLPFQRREADSETLTIGQEQVSRWNFHYRVLTPFHAGFVAVSKAVAFRFEIVAPVAVFPPQQAELSLATLKKTDRGGLLLTWERTYFSDAYLLEVSRSPDFSRSEVARTVKNNFAVLKGLQPGTYHWRVKAVGLKRESAWSAPRQLRLVL
ncbi:MAG: fibronectin type III domain-containing protein [Bdellovibrionales bacterium]|nr:fibronectin type III domain-containing protein [Bdellovibrionales bacterium]